MLDVLGLEADDERVYRALLGRPNSTAMLLSDLLVVSPADVDKALSRLVGWGLVIGSADDQFTAAPPAMALGALISQRRDGLRTAEHALVTFAEEHRAAMTGNSINDLIEVVTGVDAIRHRFLQVQQAARTQVRSFITAPFLAVPPGENTAEPAPSAAACTSGWYWTGRCWQSRASSPMRSIHCATACNFVSPTNCR